METTPGKLTRHCDHFLDFYNHSADAMRQVHDTLTKFDHMVGLATERAITELEMPYDNVIQFPVRPQPTPDIVA